MNDANSPSQTKSKKRIADHGEVFTNEREVKAMLDLLPQTIWCNTSDTFLEPACGNGNFLAEILSRKLNTALAKSQTNKSQKSPKYSQSHYERFAVKAVSSIYGIELLADNCVECRERLFNLFLEQYQQYFPNTNAQVIAVIQFLFNKNIINGNALTLKDLNNNPIVFSEWKFISDTLIIRRDYIYENLVEKIDNASPIDGKFIAKPITDYPQIDFLNLTSQ